MIRALDRMILGETLPYWLYGILAFTTLILGGRGLYEVAGKAIEYNIPFLLAAKLILLQAPQIISYTIPMSTLFGILLGLGRLSGDNEMVALRAAGFNFLRVFAPIFLFAFFVSIAAIIGNDLIVPRTNAAFARILNEIKSGNAGNLQAGQLLFEHKKKGVRDFVLTADSMAENELLSAVLIEFDSRGQFERLVTAESVRFGEDRWRFRNATVINPGGGGAGVQVVNSPKLDKITPESIIKFAQGARELTFVELKEKIRDLIDVRQNYIGKDIRKLQFELYNKIFLPFASFTFALVGAPLALRPQRSSHAIGMGNSLIIIVLYYIVLSIARTFAMGEGLPVIFWASLPNALVAFAGVALLWRAIR